MQDFEFRGFTRKCTSTGATIAAGEAFYTVIRPGTPDQSEYQREDFCVAAWKGPPEDAIAWWRSVAIDSGYRKPKVPSEVILEYFENLELDTERLEERFVLALLMARRRILRIDGDGKDELGRETMELFCHRNEKSYQVVVAMPKSKKSEREIEQRIVRLLDQANLLDASAATALPPALSVPSDSAAIDAASSDAPQGISATTSISQATAAPLIAWVFLLGCLTLGTGCLPSWLRRQTDAGPPPPVAYERMPTIQEVVQFNNDHSMRVRQLQAQGATISYKAPPLSVAIPLQAKLSFDMPRRVRLTAGLGLGGDLVDVGSNDDIFWFWAKPTEPTRIFFAKHEAYPASALGRMIPLDPSWIADALGLAYLDPNARFDGPFPSNQKGMFDIRTWLETPAGDLQRVITFDQKYGYVRAQYLYDPYGKLMAQIRGNDHRYDSAANVTIAHDIAISLPQVQAQIQFNAQEYILNAIGYDNGGRLWEPPLVPGSQMVDIADPSFDPRRYLGQPGMAQSGPLSPGIAKDGRPTLRTPAYVTPVYPVSQQSTTQARVWQGPRQVYLGSGDNMRR